MLFKPEFCQLILLGLKTQTRRLVKSYDAAGYTQHGDGPWFLGQVSRYNRCLWRVGETYSIQPGRGKHQVGRIRITAIRRERLQEISPADLVAEGFFDVAPQGHGCHITGPGPDACQTMWDTLNRGPGESWADNPLVWVLTFEVAK